MQETNQYLIQIETKSKNLEKKFSHIINRFGEFKIIKSNDSRVPDLLIYGLGESTQKDIKYVETLLDTGKIEEIFLTSDYADIALLKKAMSAGVNEFFVQPIEENEVERALKRFKKRNQESISQQPKKNGKVITVFGSKGGVGTTTVAVNIATSIKNIDGTQSVALIDMNTLFGEIPFFLEMSPKFHWGEITKNIDRLDTTFLSNILSIHQSGVHVLPSPAYLNGHNRPTPSIMIQILSIMKEMFDFIIIDGGQSTNDTSLKVLEMSDSILLITILSLPCLANSNKLIKSFTDLGYVQPDRIKVILNRNMNKSNISLYDVEKGIGRKLYWTISNDFVSSMASINQGKPLLNVAPKAHITKNICDLANSLSNSDKKIQKKKWSLFKRK
jgi:pilus assembly protein CpaE